jgi:CRP-like cAMP-binding protein
MSMDPTRLTAIPLFSSLSPEEARRLAAFATETSVSEGQILMKEGDFSTELIAIEEGTADVIKGGEQIATLGAGDLIGEMGLLSRELRSADVVATSPMLVIRLTHWEVRRMSTETIDKIEGVIRERRASGTADPYQ